MTTNRSNSSFELRNHLKTNYVIVPEIADRVSFDRYMRLAKILFEEAVSQLNENSIHRAYVSFYKLQILLLQRLPKHPAYKQAQNTRNAMKTASAALNLLEKVVELMDEEEDRKTAFNSTKPQTNVLTSISPEEIIPEIITNEKIVVRSPSAPVQDGFSSSSSSLKSSSRFSILEANSESRKSEPTNFGNKVAYQVPDINYSEEVETFDTSFNSATVLDPADIDILRHISDINSFFVPPPTTSTLDIRIGKYAFVLLQDDFHVSYTGFLQSVPPELQMARSALETNRCFYIHLGIACQVHPFALQCAFRYYVTQMTKALTGDNSWILDIVSSISVYSGFVDANALSFLWPQEFDNFRICFISGPLSAPILSVFCNARSEEEKERLTEIVIRSTGSHFTLLRPVRPNNGNSFKIISGLVKAARQEGLVVQENEVMTQLPGQSVKTALLSLKGI